MSVLRIHLFGGMDLSWPDGVPLAFPTQKARHLFAFLVLHRDRHYPREMLLGLFWGDRPEAVARKGLRTDLWRIRSVLEPAGGRPDPALVVQDHQVGFNTAVEHWLDVAEFERRIAAVEDRGEDALAPDDARRLQEAVLLYRGDLLEGVYEDWCLYERERLRLLFLTALERLMLHHRARREWDLAIAAGQRLLTVDPVLEHVHRCLMRCYHLQGNRPAALRQFATCAEVLRRELDVEPMEETMAVYEEIRAGGASVDLPHAPASAAVVLARAERLLAEVDATLRSLYTVTHQLEVTRDRLSHELICPPRPG